MRKVEVSGYDFYQSTLKFLNNIYYGIMNEKPIEDILFKTDGAKDPIKEVASTLSKIRYDADHLISLDFPQSADVTLLRRAGDCEDFARLAACVLYANKVSSKIVVMYREKDDRIDGHAVCLATIGDKNYVFDVHHMIQADTLQDALSYYAFLGYDIFFIYNFDMTKKITERITPDEPYTVNVTRGTYIKIPYIDEDVVEPNEKMLLPVVLLIMLGIILIGVIR